MDSAEPRNIKPATHRVLLKRGVGCTQEPPRMSLKREPALYVKSMRAASVDVIFRSARNNLFAYTSSKKRLANIFIHAAIYILD